MGGHVFISYSRRDYEFVISLADHLVEAGVEVWLDRDIELGERWIPVIESKVASCAVFLLVMSPHSAASAVVQDEIALAMRKNRKMSPFLLDGEPMFPGGSIQYVDVRDRRLPNVAEVAKLRQLAPRAMGATGAIGAGAAPAHLIGSIGAAALSTALIDVDAPIDLYDPPFDEAVIERSRAWLRTADPRPEVVRAAAVVDDLGFALQTKKFLRANLPDAMSTKLLRTAATQTLRTGLRAGLESDSDYIEHVALAYPASDTNCRPAMTEFVLNLALNAGRDVTEPAFQQWFHAAGTAVWANDVIARLAARKMASRLRLVVSLGNGLATDSWPESIRAWLLEDDVRHDGIDIPCDPDQSGVEAAIREAIDWGEELAEILELPLHRLEIAAPSGLVLAWRPECVQYGPLLGVGYDVVVRWSERIQPRRNLNWINHYAKGRLQAMTAAPEPAVDWLRDHDVLDASALRTQLQNGRYAGALAIAERRSIDGRIFDLLLQFSPIVLWPDPGDEFPVDHHATVVEHWDLLPVGFLEAYRTGWRDEVPGPLAQLRAVWTDEEWLRFCATVRIGR